MSIIVRIYRSNSEELVPISQELKAAGYKVGACAVILTPSTQYNYCIAVNLETEEEALLVSLKFK